jgi:hypothetical protein
MYALNEPPGLLRPVGSWSACLVALISLAHAGSARQERLSAQPHKTHLFSFGQRNFVLHFGVTADRTLKLELMLLCCYLLFALWF